MEQQNPVKEQHQKQIVSQYSFHPLFDIKTKLVTDGLRLASCNPEHIETEDQIRSDELSTEMESKLIVSEVKSCNTCQVHFNDRAEQLAHYKSDWHRYNLHLRLKEAQPVTEEKFETMLGDVSSISGSDEDEESDETTQNIQVSMPVVQTRMESPLSSKQRNSHKVFFTNSQGELICLHRCLLHHKKNPIFEKDNVVAAAKELPMKTKWAVLMVTSGHFAGAVFDKNEVIEHKTFHRYTVRKKRGSVQSSHDSKGQHANSAGANLRRYNEAALTQEVQELLAKWKDLLRECHLIFMRVPVANRSMFYAGKNAPLQKDDERIRVIPFPTRRPTFSELKRVHQILASIECFGKADTHGSLMPRSPQKIYDKESGQLQVKDPTLSPRSKQGKTKPKVESDKHKGQKSGEAIPAIASKNAEDQPEFDDQDENMAEDEVDMELVEETVVIDLNNLKEFESSPKKRRNKKKVPSKIADFSLDEREIRWRNSLFASSKNGNETIFNTILNEIVSHYKENGELVTTLPSSTKDHTLPYKKETSYSENESVDSNPICHDNQSVAGAAKDPPEVREKELAATFSSQDESLQEANAGESETSQNMWPKQVVDFLNRPLGDGGQTLLHAASKEGQAQMVHLLLESGADPSIKDKSGKLPYNVGSSDVRNAYRRFMSLWPDKYDYSAAQVPSPLTEEMEAERKKKNAEKRKAKKKASNERNKEKKAAEALVREEEEEKKRFLGLSEREKRALAAERRLMQQHNTEGTATPALSRCWQCGLDITGKVPFEYNDFKFCTTKCLRDHRSQR